MICSYLVQQLSGPQVFQEEKYFGELGKLGVFSTSDQRPLADAGRDLFADQGPFGDLPYRQTRRMKASRSVHIVDDEAEVRDALTLLLSTAQIELYLRLGGRDRHQIR